MHGGPRKFFHRKNKKRTQLPRTAITTGEKNSTTPIFQNHRPLKTYFSQSIPPSLQTEENAPGLPNFKPRLWQSILLRNCSSFAPPKFLCNFCIVTPFHLRIAFEFWPVGKKKKKKKKSNQLNFTGLGWDGWAGIHAGALATEWQAVCRGRLPASQSEASWSSRELHFPEASWVPLCFSVPEAPRLYSY